MKPTATLGDTPRGRLRSERPGGVPRRLTGGMGQVGGDSAEAAVGAAGADVTAPCAVAPGDDEVEGGAVHEPLLDGARRRTSRSGYAGEVPLGVLSHGERRVGRVALVDGPDTPHVEVGGRRRASGAAEGRCAAAACAAGARVMPPRAMASATAAVVSLARMRVPSIKGYLCGMGASASHEPRSSGCSRTGENRSLRRRRGRPPTNRPTAPVRHGWGAARNIEVGCGHFPVRGSVSSMRRAPGRWAESGSFSRRSSKSRPVVPASPSRGQRSVGGAGCRGGLEGLVGGISARHSLTSPRTQARRHARTARKPEPQTPRTSSPLYSRRVPAVGRLTVLDVGEKDLRLRTLHIAEYPVPHTGAAGREHDHRR